MASQGNKTTKECPGNKNIKEWEKIFNELDTDHSGSLSKAELTKALKANGSNLPDSQIDSVFEYFDGKGGNKSISLQEFTKGLELIEKYICDLKKLFDQFDCDKSGFLDKKEAEKLLRSDKTHPFTDNEICEIIKAADVNKDGKISFHEFITAFT